MRKVLYLFGKLSDQDMDWLLGAGKREDVPVGTLLIREGEFTKTLYVILGGHFRVTARGQVIAEVAPGEVIGELSFLDGLAPAASVTATLDSVVVSYSMKRLRSRLKFDSGFAGRFYLALSVMLADRLRQSVIDLARDGAGNADDSLEAHGELSSALLDESSLAGVRFDTMRRRFLDG